QRQLLRRAYGDEMHLFTAGFDKSFAVTMGADAQARMGQIIDVARGAGAAPAPAVKAALDAARARRSSVGMFMNIVRTMAPGTSSASGMTMEFGVAEGAARMRIGMPAAHVRELQAATLSPPR